jgi:hypothetical protein
MRRSHNSIDFDPVITKSETRRILHAAATLVTVNDRIRNFMHAAVQFTMSRSQASSASGRIARLAGKHSIIHADSCIRKESNSIGNVKRARCRLMTLASKHCRCRMISGRLKRLGRRIHIIAAPGAHPTGTRCVSFHHRHYCQSDIVGRRSNVLLAHFIACLWRGRRAALSSHTTNENNGQI